MEKTYKNCQSCGMPLKKDPEQGGTNADGSKSTMYCSYCYKNGAFTQPDLTAEQMREFVKEKLREMRFHSLFAGLFTRNIHKLKRWNP